MPEAIEPQPNIVTPKEHPDLYQKTVRGGVWLMAERVTLQIFAFLRLFVLARLLAPREFGILGIALILLQILETFTQTGFNTTLVQRKEEDVHPYLNTVWTSNVIRGSLLFFLFCALAPLAIPFFDRDSTLDHGQLAWIIRTISFVLLCRAFSNPAIIYFTKTLRFEKHFAIHFGATVVNVSVTVLLAIILRSVWALVWGMVLAELTSLVLSYVMYPWRPRVELDRAKLGQLWRFGRWITGLSMLEFLLNTGDSLLVGRLLGATPLGLYQMSTRLSALPIREFTAVMAQASFPAFCRIQTDIVRLRQAFLKTIDITSALVMPAVGGLLLFSDDIVRLFMQESWLPMVSTLRILAILGLFRTLPVGALFHAMGKPSSLAIFMAVRIVLIAVLFYPLTQRYGIDGMAWTITLSGLVLLLPGYFLLMQLLKCGVGTLLRHQAAQGLGSLVMIGAIGTVKLWLWTEMGYLRFFVLAAAAAFIYGSVCLVLTPIFKAQWLAFAIERWRQLGRIANVKTASSEEE